MKAKVLRNITLALIMLMIMGTATAYASDLDGVGAEQEETVEVINEGVVETTEVAVPVEETVPVEESTATETPLSNEVEESNIPKLEGISEDKKQEMENTATAVGEMFGNTSISEESIAEANRVLRPFAEIMNKVMAGILGITALLMMLVTVLDLSYIALPFTRDLLDGGMKGQGQMQGQGPMQGGGYSGAGPMRGGMGGFNNGGMGGMGGFGARQPQQQRQETAGGGLSAIGRVISDEALAAATESQQSGSVKSMIGSYMKKRSFFLIMFGICVILLTSSVFTDLGVRLGMWALKIFTGLGM